MRFMVMNKRMFENIIWIKETLSLLKGDSCKIDGTGNI